MIVVSPVRCVVRHGLWPEISVESVCCDRGSGFSGIGEHMSGYLSDEAYQAYLSKHATWNFWVNVLDLTFFNTAMSFIYGATVLSLYASYLTGSAVLIGLIPALQGVMFLLPQMLLARRTQSLSRMKPFLARISIFERLPYSIVALSIFLWPNAPRGLAYATLLFVAHSGHWQRRAGGTGLESHAGKGHPGPAARHAVRYE